MASSLEKTFETAFSAPPPSHTAFHGTTLTIGLTKVRLGQVIAEGGFSFIHIATPLSSNDSTRRFAVKRLPCHDGETRRLAEQEVSFLQSLAPHPNIVAFHGATFREDHAFLLFDLIDGGTLPERLQRPTRAQRREPEDLLSIFSDIVNAVAHLHAMEPPVTLRDVKLENVLYDRLTSSYKLCDFGSVTTRVSRPTTRPEILATEEDISQNCTTMYCAPELADLYSGKFICEKTDVWALGCIWHALLYGQLPFDGSSSLAISNGLRQIPSTPAYPADFVQILHACLTVDPAERPDSFALLAAICRLQGRAMKAEYHIAAQRIRPIRNADFGRPPTSVEIQLTLEDLDVEQKAESDLTVTLAPYFAHQNSTPSTSTPQNQGDGWADFTSAFGDYPSSNKAPISNQPAVNSSSSATKKQVLPNEDLMQLFSQSALPTQPTKSVPSRPNASEKPLIDFTDMNEGTTKPSVQNSNSVEENDILDFFR